MLKSKAEPVKTKFSDSPWRIPVILGLVVIGVATAYYFGLIRIPSFGQSNNFYEIEQQATVGVPYSANFAKSLIPLLDPNYNGDSSTYTFSLGSGTGFPPIGLVLSPDGTLSGTPTGQSSTFQVCVKDASGKSICKNYHLNVNSASETNPLVSIQQGVENNVEKSITVSPNSLIVIGKLCKEPCVVSAEVVVSSKVAWHVPWSPPVCFDPLTEESYNGGWSVCPASGGPGDTKVTISTKMYYVASSSVDSSDRLRSQQTVHFYEDNNRFNADLDVALELPYWNPSAN